MIQDRGYAPSATKRSDEHTKTPIHQKQIHRRRVSGPRIMRHPLLSMNKSLRYVTQIEVR